MKWNPRTLAMSLALLTSAVAYAQTIHVQATVPFKFNVGKVLLPAGKYDVQTAGNGTKILSIRNLNADAGSFAISHSSESSTASTQTKLIFRRYGQRYFLAEVWSAGNTIGHRLQVGPLEEELARNPSKQSVVLMAAQK